MTKFELWKHTTNTEMATLVVLPMPSYEISYADYVQGRLRTGSYLEIEDLQVLDSKESRNQKQGRGTILVDAIAKFAKKNNRTKITGHFVTNADRYDYVEEWYRKHGIQIENGYLVGNVDKVLAMCAQIKSNYSLFYDLVDKPKYDIKKSIN